MKNLAESLSLGSGAVIIALLSMAVVWLLCSVLPVPLRWLAVVLVPLGLAYSVYWLPVWLGADPSEYGAWAVLVVGAWFLAGSISSAALLIFRHKRRAS